MGAAMRLAVSGVGVYLRQRHAGARGFSHIERRAVSAKGAEWRPFRQNRKSGWRQRCKLLGGMNYFSTHHGEHGFNSFDLLLGHGKIVLAQHDKIRELSGGERPLLAGLV